MKVISPTAHRALDFSTVAIFALAPFVIGFGGAPAYLSWTLASIHLILTLATRFETGGPAPVSLPMHGVVELVVGLILLSIPFLMGWSGGARLFYVLMGLVVLGVWLTTRYEGGV